MKRRTRILAAIIGVALFGIALLVVLSNLQWFPQLAHWVNPHPKEAGIVVLFLIGAGLIGQFTHKIGRGERGRWGAWVFCCLSWAVIWSVLWFVPFGNPVLAGMLGLKLETGWIFGVAGFGLLINSSVHWFGEMKEPTPAENQGMIGEALLRQTRQR